MKLFSDINFFLALIIAIIPAVILGLMQKSLSIYGFIISIIFLAMNFYHSKISIIYLILFIIIQMSVTYFFLHKRKTGKQKWFFYFVILMSILPLVLYKIGAVFDKNILGFLGISYITFKSVQVIIEIQDGIIKKLNLFDYLYFLLFFSTFTSGPIDRSRRFEKDIRSILPGRDYADLLSKGILYLLLGAVYKFVLSIIFVNWDTFSTIVLGGKLILTSNMVNLINLYFYGFYLFFDFAGYSLMAVGASYCFGIQTPKNFDKPFMSIDMKEFWNRWHITLSFWLRDFVFTRFVMLNAKKKWFKQRLTTACYGYIINMLIMGFWHGLSWNYIIYGLYHGVLLSLTDIYQKKSKFYKKYKDKKLYKFISWFITFNLVIIGFAIFSNKMYKIIPWLLEQLHLI